MQGNNMNELHIEYMPVEQLQHYCKNSKMAFLLIYIKNYFQEKICKVVR